MKQLIRFEKRGLATPWGKRVYKQAQFRMATHCILFNHLEIEILARHTQVSVLATRGLLGSSRYQRGEKKSSDDFTAFCKTFCCVLQECNGQHSEILYTSQRSDARMDYFGSRSAGVSLRCEVCIQVCVLRCFLKSKIGRVWRCFSATVPITRILI